MQKESTEGKKVNLFVVGAMKAGTTSLCDWLGMHPEVFVPTIKEPHHFVNDLPSDLYEAPVGFSLRQYFEETTPRQLHIAHVQSSDYYSLLYEGSESYEYRLDGSSMYLHFAEAARRIHDYNPQSRILIILRDPLARAYSHFKMNRELGREGREFSEAMRASLAYRDDSTDYCGMSQYDEGVDRFRAYFGDRVLVTTLERILSSQGAELDRLLSFLRLESVDVPWPKSNQSRSVRFPRLMHWVYSSGLKKHYSRWIPPLIRQGIFRLMSTRARQHDLPQDLKERLTRHWQTTSKTYYDSISDLPQDTRQI